MPDSIHHQLIQLLRPLGRRLRLRSAIDLLTRTAWLALAASGAVLLAGRLFPLDGYRLVAGGVFVLWLIAWAVVSILRPVRPFTTARRADAELGLHDRLSTALVLADPSRTLPAGFDRTLVAHQLADALAIAEHVDPRSAFPIRIERAPLARAAAALFVAILLLALPNPMDQVIAQQAQVAQAAQEQAAQLEKLAQEVEQDQTLKPEDKSELLRQMRELIKQLRADPADAKKALANLAKFQEQLRAKLNPRAPSEQAALVALAQQLAQLADAQDQPKDADGAKLLEELAQQLEQLSPEKREALAAALDRAAAQTAASNPDLASALSAMAQAARSGSADGKAQQASQRAAQALRDSMDQQALQEALARALNQAESSQRAMAQANGQGNQGNQGNTGNQGNSGQGNQGQGQGQANQAGGGGGTNANQLPPAVRSGTAGSPTGPNKSFGTGDTETVYSPFSTGQGREEFVGGQQGSQGETTSKEGKSPQPGTTGPALVPYSQVYEQYAQIAGQTMERSYIPPGLKDFVKEYFSGLEP